MVVDGLTLSWILANYRREFVELSARAASAICCRVTPLQKAEVVAMVQETLGMVCLAIGDGGNDVSMIQQAHLGVGIKGREGAQAARAADFAVPQFRCLERLLLVHGRYSLLRNTKVIYISFYKNVAVFLSSIWFSFFTGGSGQVPFPLPFFVFECLHEWIIQKHPQSYGQQKYLKFSTLVSWLGFGILHSLFIFWGSWKVAGEVAVHQDGKVADIHEFGSFVLAVGFCVVLFKMVLETQHFVVWTIVALLVSCANFVAFELIESYGGLHAFPEFFGVWSILFSCFLANLIFSFHFS